MRGEHSVSAQTSAALKGSSPLARGTPELSVRVSVKGRIIPACAGNTGQRSVSVSALPGSSPLARGTRPPIGVVRLARRIIPACAGNTPDSLGLVQQTQDHPRLRGEHRHVQRHIASRGRGSSPLARGTPRKRGECGLRLRIIPACAGNTQLLCAGARFNRDHPRLRGEHSHTPRGRHERRGSSPLARGTRRSARGPRRCGRIIPACAGNTRPSMPVDNRRRDHPRLRGEHAHGRAGSERQGGSSPLARGTQW